MGMLNIPGPPVVLWTDDDRAKAGLGHEPALSRTKPKPAAKPTEGDVGHAILGLVAVLIIIWVFVIPILKVFG